MQGPNDSSQSQSTTDGSFLDLLGETLGSLDSSVRGQFLAHFFKSFAHIELSDVDSVAVWDRALERHRELSESLSRPVSLETAVIDVIENMNLLHMPILVEYRELRKLQVSAATDALTGLYNRRLFEEYFEKELSRAKRFTQQLALVIIDLHRLKEVNDRFGHQKGDHALRLAAAAALETVRASDFTFRIGGDEFAMLLPRCDRVQCTALCQRLRARYEAAVTELRLDVSLTLDFGIAVSPEDGEQRETMIHLADMRLYEMKNTTQLRVGEAPHEPLELRGAADALIPSQTNRSKPIEESPRERREAHGRDKRKWERVPLAGTSAHIVWNEGAPRTAPIIDVSYGGLSLLVENPEIFPTLFQALLHMPIHLPVMVSLRKSNEKRIHRGMATRLGCVFVTEGAAGDLGSWSQA
jgi:diguanylate cyclase (GGDEF)-like protein